MQHLFGVKIFKGHSDNRMNAKRDITGWNVQHDIRTGLCALDALSLIRGLSLISRHFISNCICSQTSIFSETFKKSSLLIKIGGVSSICNRHSTL